MEAWLELTELYLSRQNFEKAQFCYEEILSMQPHNPLVNLRYAEILYSTANCGGESIDTLYLARKYYSHALALQSDKGSQTRALWGLLQTCKAIETVMKKEDVKNTEVMRTCQAKINEIYERPGAAKVNLDGMKLMS